MPNPMIIKPAVTPATTILALSSKVSCIDVSIISTTTRISLSITPRSNNKEDLNPLLMLVCINRKNAGPKPKTVANVSPINAP